MPDQVITLARRRPSVTGLAALSDHDCVPSRAVWFEFGSMRGDPPTAPGRRLRSAGRRWRGVRFRRHEADEMSGSRRVLHGDCLCCVYLADVLTEADRFLVAHRANLQDPPGSVRAHLRQRELAAWTRSRRVEIGALARPERMRTYARGRALPDALHRALFEYVVDEAGSLAPLEESHGGRRRSRSSSSAGRGPPWSGSAA